MFCPSMTCFFIKSNKNFTRTCNMRMGFRRTSIWLLMLHTGSFGSKHSLAVTTNEVVSLVRFLKWVCSFCHCFKNCWIEFFPFFYLFFKTLTNQPNSSTNQLMNWNSFEPSCFLKFIEFSKFGVFWRQRRYNPPNRKFKISVYTW